MCLQNPKILLFFTVNGGGKGKPNKPKDPRQKTQTTFELLKVVKYYLQLHFTRYVCKWDTGWGASSGWNKEYAAYKTNADIDKKYCYSSFY